MRTSRISRDAQKVATSLSTTRTQPLRQTRARNGALQNFALKGAGASVVSPRHDSDSAQSESELSSVSDDVKSESESEVDSSMTRKRKRGQDAPAPPTSVSRRTERVAVTTIPKTAKQSSAPKKARRVPAKKKVGADGSVKVEPPPNWEEIYTLTRKMRDENVAPVDTMGCESLADRKDTPRNQRFQTLVALMLSSQTKDTVTSVAIWNMQKTMPGGFNLETIFAMEPSVLNSYINKVGFHNLKTKYIKQAAEILRDKWNSDIPDTIEGLVSLPGVGPKMGYLCLSAAWGKDEGIGVDVHVHRITNLWGWHKTKNPEDTRAALESWLPKEKWHDINNLLVGFGQTICLPVGRKCGDCYLAEKGLCPSAVVAKTAKVKREAVVVKKEGLNGEQAVQEELATVEEQEIKAEDLDSDSIPDIEDIGKRPRRAIKR